VDAIKPVTESQNQISNISAHYIPFAPIFDNSNNIKEEQWALTYTNNNENDKACVPVPVNLLLKGSGISDLAKQVRNCNVFHILLVHRVDVVLGSDFSHKFYDYE